MRATRQEQSIRSKRRRCERMSEHRSMCMIGGMRGELQIRSQSKRRITDFYRHRRFHWQVIFPLILTLGLTAPLLQVYSSGKPWPLGMLATISFACFAFACAVVLWWSYLERLKQLARNDFRETWEKLRKKRSNECPWCGYDVRGCPTPSCSECGKLIEPPSEDSVQTYEEK